MRNVVFIQIKVSFIAISRYQDVQLSKPFIPNDIVGIDHSCLRLTLHSIPLNSDILYMFVFCICVSVFCAVCVSVIYVSHSFYCQIR